MKSLFRASAYLCGCWLLAAATGCGGGGGDSAPTASAPTPSAPPPAMSMPGDAADAGATPAPLPDASDGSGAIMPGDPVGNGMPMSDGTMADAGMAMPGMGMPGMGMNEGMAMAGMPGMGMPGMPGMGMPGMGMNGPRDPSPSDDDDSLTKAKYAFSIGKEKAAEQYLYAHILTNDAEAPGLLQQIRWSPISKKPTSTLRFAVGVELKAPPNVQDYQPIGRTQFANQGNQGGGAAGGEMVMGTGMPGGQPTGAQKSFGDLTGRFGEELMKSFETAWDAGSFGTVFKDVETVEPFVRTPGMNGMNGMMGGMPGGGMPGSFGLDGGMPGEGMGMPGQNGQPGTTVDATPRMRAQPGKVVVPGLLYLGTGSLNELVGKAETEGIDFVFIFDVEVKITRFITNETRLRLVATKDQSNIAATSTLKSLTVDRDVARGEKDEVTKQLGNVFKKLDAYKLADLPKLQPVHAQARIKSLIEKSGKEQLGTLMEIKLFHSLGLLNDEERDAAYQLAIGGNGIAFASGTVEDREFVLKPLLPAYK